MGKRSFLTANVIAYASETKQIEKSLKHKIDNLEDLKKAVLQKVFNG